MSFEIPTVKKKIWIFNDVYQLVIYVVDYSPNEFTYSNRIPPPPPRFRDSSYIKQTHEIRPPQNQL